MGHGAGRAVAFVFLLQRTRIETLVDVRAYRVSRRPQFSRCCPGENRGMRKGATAHGERVVPFSRNKWSECVSGGTFSDTIAPKSRGDA